jgi:hypothetical protein
MMEVRMPENIVEAAFLRQSSALVGRLRLGRGYLLQAASGSEWEMWTPRNGFTRAVTRAPDPLVAEMRKRGLLEERPGGGLMLASGRRSRAENGIIDPDGRAATAERREAECALDWLRGRKHSSGAPLLSDELFEAADRLRADYTLAQLEQRVTADLENWVASGSRRVGRATQFTAGERALAARDRLNAALSHVGPELSGILLEVCCMASGLEAAERALGLPRRSGRTVLGMALTRLARHYGLIAQEDPATRDPLRRWAAPGYLPHIAR